MEEIRSVFRRGLRMHHPDVQAAGAGVGVDADAKTREFITAYRTIETSFAPNAVATKVDEYTAAAFVDDEATSSTFSRRAEEPVAQRLSSEPLVRRGQSCEYWLVGTDTIALGCPADEAYPLLVDAAHRLGDVTHVDRSSHEFLEFLVRNQTGDTLSVVCSLQGRSNGSTEAFFTVEPFNTVHGPVPDVGEIVQLVVQRLAV